MASEVVAHRMIAGDRWVARRFSRRAGGGRRFDRFELRKNGRLVIREDDTLLWNAAFLRWPYRAPLFVLSSHTGCGHGQDNQFYLIRNHKLFGPILTLGGEGGGPVFRDLDHDGRLEMVFDDWDFYAYGDGPPRKLLVYKVEPSYRIRYWKTLRNPKGRSMPLRMPRF